MTLNITANTLYRMKVACQGPNIWVYINDMNTPAITEYDSTYTSGAIGFKSVETFALFDNALVSNLGARPGRRWSKTGRGSEERFLWPPTV